LDAVIKNIGDDSDTEPYDHSEFYKKYEKEKADIREMFESLIG
jgi:hypothetical protein